MISIILSFLCACTSFICTCYYYNNWIAIVNRRIKLSSGEYATIGNDMVYHNAFKTSVVFFVISIIIFILTCIFKKRLNKRCRIILNILLSFLLLGILFYEFVWVRASMVI